LAIDAYPETPLSRFNTIDCFLLRNFEARSIPVRTAHGMDAFVRALAIGLVDARDLVIGHRDTCSCSLEGPAQKAKHVSVANIETTLRVDITVVELVACGHRPSGVQKGGAFDRASALSLT
jgi:hypothetical protein